MPPPPSPTPAHFYRRRFVHVDGVPELLLGAGEAVEGALLCADRLGRVGCAALLRRALQQDETHSRRGVCSGPS